MSDMRHLLDIINESEFYKEDIEIGDNFDLEIGEDLLVETFVADIDGDMIILEGDDKTLELLAEYGVDLEESDIIKGNFPKVTDNTEVKSDKIDYFGLYKELTGSQNYKLAKTKGQLSTDDNWLKLATGYLKSKGYDKVNPKFLSIMADKLLDMHQKYSVKPAAESKKMSRILEGMAKAPMRMGTGGGDAAESGTRTLGEEDDLDEAKYQGRTVPLGKPMKGDVKKSKVYVKKPNGKVVKVNFGDKKMKIKKSNPKRRKSFRARHNCKNPGPRWKARYWSCRAW